MVPRVLPPVGTRGRPLRDLEDSPALGESQSRLRGVEEKFRVAGGDRVGADVSVRASRADRRPENIS